MNEKSLKILWVSPRWLIPINDGARRATHQLLKLTTQDKKFKCDLILWSDKKEDIALAYELKERYKLESVVIYRRYLSWLPDRFKNLVFMILGFIFQKPFSVFNFFSFHIIFLNLIGHFDKYDRIIFDAPHSAFSFLKPFSNTFYSKRPFYVLRAHNVETLIWHKEKKKISSFFLKKIMSYQIFLMKNFEKAIARNSVFVACVSKEDATRFEKIFKVCINFEIPISFSFNQNMNFNDADLIPHQKNTKINVEIGTLNSSSKPEGIKWGFIGKLNWPPNHDGLLWFLNNIWPHIEKTTPHQLIIAGSGPLSKELEEAISNHCIDFIGSIEDTTEFYKKVDAVIIPIFYGGGTRVKAIEAINFKKIIISTRLGVEGLGLDPQFDYIRAENDSQWIESIKDIKKINGNNLITLKIENAFRKMSDKFSDQSVQKKWVQNLEEVKDS